LNIERIKKTIKMNDGYLQYIIVVISFNVNKAVSQSENKNCYINSENLKVVKERYNY